jgi:hypothetical protein
MRPAAVIEFPLRRAQKASDTTAGPEDLGWRLIGWAGLTLLLVGGQDLLMAAVPVRGDSNWPFATLPSVLNSLPALTIGAALVAGSAAVRGNRWIIWGMTALLFVLGAAILVAFPLYAMAAPSALAAAKDPAVLLDLKTAIASTAVQSAVYPLAFTAMGIAAIRHTARSL